MAHSEDQHQDAGDGRQAETSCLVGDPGADEGEDG